MLLKSWNVRHQEDARRYWTYNGALEAANYLTRGIRRVWRAKVFIDGPFPYEVQHLRRLWNDLDEAAQEKVKQLATQDLNVALWRSVALGDLSKLQRAWQKLSSPQRADLQHAANELYFALVDIVARQEAVADLGLRYPRLDRLR